MPSIAVDGAYPAIDRFKHMERRSKNKPRYESLAEFYPHYLAEHSNPVSRALHITGTLGVVTLAAGAVATRKPRLLLAAPLAGYGLAWLGHFLFERNKPATFKQPLYSLASDFLMFRDVVLRRLPPPPTQDES